MKIDADEARILGLNPEKLPTSCFLGVVDLKDVIPFTKKHAAILRTKRASTGTWRPDYFAWILKRPRRIRVPIGARGQLNLFKVSARAQRRIANLLSK
jgi:hypothetical protein